MSVEIEQPASADELTEFLLFQDKINEQRDAWWPVIVDMNLPSLLGQGAAAEGRTFYPLVARRHGEIVARVCAIEDRHYIDHWNEPLGHTSMFEALPGADDAVRPLMDAAGSWLRERGMTAARAGFGLFDFPFSIDAYDILPPVLLRTNPAYYHTFLKESGYETERAWVDYKIDVTQELIDRWTRYLDDARARGFDIRPLSEIHEDRRIDDFNDTWNETFAEHWGVAPQTRAERAEFFDTLGPLGMFDLSVIAYRDDEPMGALWVAPDLASLMAATRGRSLRDDERLNFLGIGVREPARRQGVNLAMSAYAYLELVRRGATHVSYTLVLDDNWPSRRTAEKLGARICANYVVYRRNFVR